ncbi:hypothetical protein CsSME_00044718 [Camellia sinensis var. sinensis]
MDFSSLPEDQQQQLQQLQQLFQEHRQQQQQEQQQQQQIQDYASQAYDPTQVQAYDQSYYGYYQYQQDPSQSHQYSQHQEQQHQHQQQQQQQHYAYYHTDYANAYQQQPQQHEQPQIQPLSQPESAPIHQSGESQPQIAVSGASVAAPVGHQQQQNAYHPQQGGLVVGGEQANPGYPVPPGLNPAAAAAVAALSQLTQFAGTMEAAEKAMAMVGMQARGRGYGQMMGPGPGPGPGPGMGAFMGHGPMLRGPAPFRAPVDQSLYRGGGRRGGRFRGNSQGNFGNRPPRSGGTGPPSHWRGRGRGRGGPRHFPPNGASSSSHPKPSAHEKAEGEEEAAHTADNHEEPEAIQTSALKQGSTAPNKRPPQAAWCELCRVDCTSLEILEQHKNGKKHKKNLQKIEELQSTCKAVSEIQYEQTSVAESNPEVNLHTEIVQEGEDKKQTLPENLTTEPGDNENKVETEQQNDEAEQPGIPVAEQSNVQGRKPWMNHFDDQRRGMKRKMRGGRGGKRMKIDAQRRPMEPPKPKVVIPLICDLCNVKCDTQEVFDRHLAGKKHISKLKRFEGHQAMYGPMGLQALYPPNPIAQSLFVPQGPQQAFYGPQGSYPPPGSYMPPQAHHSALSAAGTGSEFQQNPNHQVSGASYDFDGQKAVQEAQQLSDLTETKQNDVVAQTCAANGVSEYEGSGLNLDNTGTGV